MQQSRSQVIEQDGLFELSAGSDVLDSPRYNHDIAPTKVHQRTGTNGTSPPCGWGCPSVYPPTHSVACSPPISV